MGLRQALFVLILLTSGPVLATGALYEGFGSHTTGGAGGTTVHVTNLKDSGPGSLRDALSGGNRTVVFDVAGDIILSSDIKVLYPFVTIDGSTAPSPGITLRNYGVILHGTPRYHSGANAHDVIIRDIRVRNAAGDGIQIAWDAYNVLVDHVSVDGSGDGNIDITHGAHDVTISWSLLGRFKKNMLIKAVSEGRETKRVSVHHSLFTDSVDRNPRVSNALGTIGRAATATTADLRNNIVANWAGGQGTDAECGAKVNIVNNLYSSPGSSVGDRRQAIIVRGTSSRDIRQSGCNMEAEAHVQGNVSADAVAIKVDINTNPEWVANNRPNSFSAPPVTMTGPCAAAHSVLAEAGVLPHDAVDQQLVNGVEVNSCEENSRVLYR